MPAHVPIEARNSVNGSGAEPSPPPLGGDRDVHGRRPRSSSFARPFAP
jgi:hypothetical protein